MCCQCHGTLQYFLWQAFSFITALQPLFKTERVKGQLAFGKPAIVKRKNIDSYNLLYAVWNNKIIKDGEPRGAGNKDGSTTSRLLKFEHFLTEHISMTLVRIFCFINSLNLIEVTVDPIELKFCIPYSLQQSYQDPPQL